MPKLTKAKLGTRAKKNWRRLQENVEAGAPAFIIFDLTLLFLKDYLQMKGGWIVGGEKDNIGLKIFQPEFINTKFDKEAIEAFEARP